MALGAQPAPPMTAPWWPAARGLTQPQVRQGERPNRSPRARAQAPQVQLELERALRPTKALPADSKKAQKAQPPALAWPKAVNPKPAQLVRPIQEPVQKRQASLRADPRRVREQRAETLAQPIPM